MTRRLALGIGLFVLCSVLGQAQNTRVDGVVYRASGFPAAGAFIAVCTQPATIGTSVAACTPLASLCSSASDVVCTSPNPVTADGLGNYNFYIKPGKYSYQFYGSGLTTRLQVDQTISTALDTNNSFTGSNTFNTLTATRLGSCRYTTGFASGSNTGGIVEAYTDGAASGVCVVMDADVTISSAQTFNMTIGKPLLLDMNGHTITCSNPSGICLTINKQDATPRYNLAIINGTFTNAANATANITGLSLGTGVPHAMTNCALYNMTFNNFSGTGATALDLNFTEDCRLDAISFTSNQLALKLDVNTNQNQISNAWFQQNVNAIQITDANEATFIDCLIQSNTGTKAVQIIASTINVVGIRFKHTHFENNGDNTTNSDQVYFSAASGKQIIRTVFEDDFFNSGAQTPAGSYIFEGVGPGTILSFTTKRNQYFTTANFIRSPSTAFVAGQYMQAESDNMTAADAGIDMQNLTGCDNTGIGLDFAPIGAGKVFQIYGGWPGNFDSDIIFKDCTGAGYILKYLGGASTWDFQGKIIKTSNQFVNTATTNQVVLGTTNTTTLSFPAPASSITITGPTATGTLTETIGTGNVTTAGTAVTNGTSQAQTGITVTNALTTDSCTANIGAALPATWQTGIQFRCDVTANGTVTVNLMNPTAGSITPAATQVNVRVTR